MNNKEIFSAGLKLLAIYAAIQALTSLASLFPTIQYLQSTKLAKYAPELLRWKVFVLWLSPILSGIIAFFIFATEKKMTDYFIVDGKNMKKGFSELPLFRTILRLVGVYCIIRGIKLLSYSVNHIMPNDLNVDEGMYVMSMQDFMELAPALINIVLGLYFLSGAKLLYHSLVRAKQNE